MSRLLIKQKVFSWTDTYEVYDANGTSKYYVKADFFSIGHRIHVYDKQTGQEVGMIQEKVLRLLKEFEIFMSIRPILRWLLISYTSRPIVTTGDALSLKSALSALMEMTAPPFFSLIASSHSGSLSLL